MKKRILLAISIVSLFLFSACRVSTEIQNEVKSEEPKGVLVTGKLLADFAEPSVSKTVLASTYPSTEYFSTYKYSMYASGAARVAGTVNAATLEYGIRFPVDGTYTITCQVYESSAKNFIGSTKISVLDGVISGDTTIHLKPIVAVNTYGKVNLPIVVSSTVQAITATWSNKTQNITITESDGKRIGYFTMNSSGSDMVNVSSAAYPVVFKFYDTATISATTVPVYSFTETVTVYRNTVVSQWINTTGAAYIDGNVVKITDEIISTYNAPASAFTVFYVDEVNGKDSNSYSGNYFMPVKTLKRAIELVEAANDGTSEFKIILRSDLSVYTGDKITDPTYGVSLYTINPNQSLKLLILPADGLSSCTISAEDTEQYRHFYIGEKADVTITDCILEKGKAPAVGGGSIVCEGEVRLNGSTKITDNHFGGAAQKGAGIYAKSAYIYVEDGSKITANGDASISGSMGGGIYADNYSYVWIDNASVDSNRAEIGGGLYLKNSGASIAETGIVHKNIADSLAGGIYFTTTNLKTLDISDGFVSENVAPIGSEIYLNSGGIALWRSSIISNKSDSTASELIYCNEGSLSIIGSSVISEGSPVIENKSLNTQHTISMNGNSSHKISLGLSGYAEIKADSGCSKSIYLADLTDYNVISVGYLRGSSATQTFDLDLHDKTLGQQVLHSDYDDIADRFTIVGGGYSINSEGYLLKTVDGIGNLASAVVLDNQLIFQIDNSTISKATGGVIAVSAKINGVTVSDPVSAFTDFKITVMNYGVPVGISYTNSNLITIPSGLGWPADKYQLYITGKYQGVEYDVTLFFDLTE